MTTNSDQDTPNEPPAAAAGSAVATVVRGQKRSFDEMPYDRSRLALLTPDERCAVYLNSIRKMMIFFTVLTILGLAAGIVIGLVGINAVHSVQQVSGGGLGY